MSNGWCLVNVVHGASRGIPSEGVDFYPLLCDHLALVQDLECEAASYAEAMDFTRLHLEVSIPEMMQFMLDDLLPWDRQLNGATGHGNVSVSLNSLAGHLGKELSQAGETERVAGLQLPMSRNEDDVNALMR